LALEHKDVFEKLNLFTLVKHTQKSIILLRKAFTFLLSSNSYLQRKISFFNNNLKIRRHKFWKNSLLCIKIRIYFLMKRIL